MPERTQLMWKWEDEDEDGEGVGPYWVDGPDGSEKSDIWVRRSVAAKVAEEHGYRFIADE